MKELLFWVIGPIVAFTIAFVICGIVVSDMNESIPAVKAVFENCRSYQINQTDNASLKEACDFKNSFFQVQT